MKTLALTAAISALTAGTGCVTLQPIGPFAKTLGNTATPTKVSRDVTVMPMRDAESMPQLPSAPPPTPPAMLIGPADVSDADPQRSVQKLIEEMDADRKATAQLPQYADVSVVR